MGRAVRPQRLALRCAALGVALACTPAAASAPLAAHGEIHPYAAPVAEAAQRFGIPEVWIWRVMHAESRGNRRALSHAGAMGLMQIMPATWAMLTARHRLGSDPFDVRANILAGAAYLRAMWDRYGDVRLMLAAYNAGPGRADAYAAGRRALPAETRAYVALIAPDLGSTGRAQLARAPAPAEQGWRDASLFSERLKRISAVDPPAAGGSPSPASEAASSAHRPASNPLFVPLSGSAE